MDSPFSIHTPEPLRALPVIFDSPHSGTYLPEDFTFICDASVFANDGDKFVDELFASAPRYGASLLCALFHRSYIDPNRAACDSDPDLLAEDWPHGPINPTERSDAGIGLIRRLIKPGIPIYNAPLSPQEIMHRIERYYRPYHKALEHLIHEAHYNFGQSWHINCHSMPSSSAYPRQAIGFIGNSAKQADFVLGDRDGRACACEFTHALRDTIKDLGYNVTINDPYKGVELVARYSEPTRGRHSLQLEINRALYMDEQTGTKNSNYNALQNDIEKIIEFCTTHANKLLIDMAAD